MGEDFQSGELVQGVYMSSVFWVVEPSKIIFLI